MHRPAAATIILLLPIAKIRDLVRIDARDDDHLSTREVSVLRPLADSDRKRSQPIRAFSATLHDGQCPCRMLAEDPGLRIPGAAAQTRVGSMVCMVQMDLNLLTLCRDK
jgi:hypothetical protein